MFFFFFFLMIRRPPSSTLFPYTRSSDLGLVQSVLRTTDPGVLRLLPPFAVSFVSMSFTGMLTYWLVVGDRKSTRLNSSHPSISYAVFCLKKKRKTNSDYH